MNPFSLHPSSKTNLHLVIPNLFNYLAEADEQLQLPFLNKLFAQSTQHTWQHPEFHSTLFALSGVPLEKNLPVAAVSRLVDANDTENYIWLRADPVHLHADRDRVLLFDQSMFTLTQAETDRLITELNNFFISDATFSSAMPCFSPRPRPIVGICNCREFLIWRCRQSPSWSDVTFTNTCPLDAIK